MLVLLTASSLLVAGCGDSGEVGPVLTAMPAHASLFGQVQVTFSGDVGSLGAISEVTVAGVHAYDVQASAGALTATLQGAPSPGVVPVRVVGASGTSQHAQVFTYDAPPSGVPLTWAAFGASLTQGTQSGGIDVHTQTHGVSAFVAQAAGTWLALPLFVPGLTPPVEPSDLNPDCTVKPGAGAGVQTLTATLTDPSTKLFDLRRGRIDWTLPPRNYAIGGSTVAEILHGAKGSAALLEHIVEDPTLDPGDVLSPETVSQIDRLEVLDPDVAFSTDLLANDLDPAVVQTDDVHPDLITPLSTVQPELATMMARLGKLHGQFFIANIPSLTFVPNVAKLRAARIAAGTDTAASFDAKVAQIDMLTDEYNQALADAMKPYPNLHLVDFKGAVDTMIAGGITIGGEKLTVQPYGGLLSLDMLHFTDTGYALYANVFVAAINQALGTSIPSVDLDAVHAADALAPARLRADGLTCVPMN